LQAIWLSHAMNERVVRSASHWGAFRVRVKDGRIVGAEPFEKDEHPSPLVQSQVEAVYDKSRIDRPYVRRGFLDRGAASDRTKRGAEPFVPVDWDTALALVSDELSRVKRDFGNTAIFAAASCEIAPASLHEWIRRFDGAGRYLFERGRLGDHAACAR
jgi:anaerobic selenocysteine-containing dehydrogenase